MMIQIRNRKKSAAGDEDKEKKLKNKSVYSKID